MKTKLFLAAAMAFGINAFAQIPTTGLVAYYPFSGNANDASGSSNNGVVTGATLVADRFGNPNSAYSFNGTSDSITCNNAPLTNYPLSISAWVKINSLSSPGDNPILNLGELGSSHLNTINFCPGYGGSGTPSIGTGGASDIASTNTVITANVWKHVVVTISSYSATNVIFYVNGLSYTVNTSQGSNNPFPLNSAGFTIGKASTGGTSPAYAYFGGILDDICIYNRVLTPTEVTQLYNITSCSADITTGLVARYDFTGNANDLSGNSNNGTVTGATLTTDRFGNANSAYSFNGTSDYILINNTLLSSTPTSYAINYWALTNAVTVYGGGLVINDRYGSDPQCKFKYASYINSHNKYDTRMYNYTTNVDVVSPDSIPNNTWVMITGVFDNTNSILNLYENGTLINSLPSNIWNSGNNPTTIGAWGAGACSPSYNNFFNGKIDGIRIYNRVLNVCDVDSLYHMANPNAMDIKQLSINTKQLAVWPNPTTSILNVQVGDFSTSLEMTVCDVLGNEVIPKSKIVNQKCALDVGSLTPGVYFVRVGTATQKFVKE